MRPRPALSWLIPLIAVLTLITTLSGIFWQGGGAQHAFTAVTGQTVQLYGQGLYRNDTVQGAATFRGTDMITLVINLPLLIFAFWQYRRGSLRGGLLLSGALGYSLYNAMSLAFGASYNPLFLVYVALFSASLFAVSLLMTSFDLDALPRHVAPSMQRRGMAIFLFVAGGVLFLVWLMDIVSGWLPNAVPQALQHSTTIVTYAMDMGIICPLAIWIGVMLLRRVPLGYPLGVQLIMLNGLVGLVVIAQTVMILMAGVRMETAQIMAFVAPFVILAGFAVWLTLNFFRNIAEKPILSSKRR